VAVATATTTRATRSQGQEWAGQQALEPDSKTPGCTAAATKAVVKGFFAAFSAGRVTDLDEFFASATRFKWYANSVRPARRLDDDALDRNSLLGYLQRLMAVAIGVRP
jgi:hypothetical protein